MSETKSILIISAITEIQETIREEMESQKYRVISATNGNEARLKISNEVFDVVVIDMDLVGLKAYEFVEGIRRKEHLKNLKEQIPVIVTGASPEMYTKNFSLMDMVNFIQAPFSKLEFKKKLLSFTGNSEIILTNTSVIAKDEYLITEGGTSHEMYWVLSGGFVITKTNSVGHNVIIGDVFPGELVGEMSFLDNLPRSASVKAKEDSEILTIPHKKFIDVLDGQPRWFRSLMQTLSQRLRSTNKMIARKHADFDHPEHAESTGEESTKEIDKPKV
jgi:CRP/FNR family cyclic AMP-dependent transcriptional regulator